MAKIITSVDPGSSGAVAWKDSNDILHCVYMPETPRDILDLFNDIISEEDAEGNLAVGANETVCYLEDVGHGMPGQSSSATAKFARHNGHLEMALLALGIKTVKILPHKWQKTLGIGSSTTCKDKSEWKNKLKAKAQELFPQFKITAKNQDALLILDYAIKQEK